MWGTALQKGLPLLCIFHFLIISDTIFLIVISFHYAVKIWATSCLKKCLSEMLWGTSQGDHCFHIHFLEISSITCFKMLLAMLTTWSWNKLVDGLNYTTAHLWEGSFSLWWAKIQFNISEMWFSVKSVPNGVCGNVTQQLESFLLNSNLNAKL